MLTKALDKGLRLVSLLATLLAGAVLDTVVPVLIEEETVVLDPL